MKLQFTLRTDIFSRFITTPLLLLDLLLTSGLPWPTILYTILFDWVMVVCGLVGALVHSSYKWGYYAFGFAAFLFVAYTVVFEGRAHARALGSDINRVYTICGVWTIFLWFLYPIAWGLCEGGNVISPDSEAAFYGVLDVLAKPGFAALLLWGHRNIGKLPNPSSNSCQSNKFRHCPPWSQYPGYW